MNHDTALAPNTSRLPPEVKAIFQQGAAALGLYAITINVIGWVIAMFGKDAGLRFQFGAFILLGALALGGLRTAEFIRWCANAFVGAALLTPALLIVAPPALLLTYIRLAPLSSLLAVGDWIAMFALAYWLTHLLKMPAVVEARARQNRPMRSERLARLIGAGLFLAGVAFGFLLVHGETARKGEAMAAREFGADYQYYPRRVQTTRSLNTGQSQTCVAVVIWNERGIGERNYCW